VRVPLLAGSRVVIVNAPDDSVVLRPPPPAEAIDDVAAAVAEAFRFPLAGRPLEEILPRGGRATIVAELPSLPIPGSDHDPRQAALAATSDELARTGIPVEKQTLLVAGGLARRPSARALEHLVVSPEFARRFHGRVVVHDTEDPALVEIGSSDGVPLRVNRALVETDGVIVVSAAESVLHGGPATLLAATGPEAQRAGFAESLLQTGGSPGWKVAVAVERALGRRAPMIGLSNVLNHPRLTGALHGYPYDPKALELVARSPLRRLFAALPGALRAYVIRSIRRELSVFAVFAGPPSVAHAEALLRGIELRQADLDEPLDAICLGVPRTTPYLPREQPNPLLVTYFALGLALRLWRDEFPVVPGGTVIMLSRFRRRFSHPTQQPYRAFFHAARTGRLPTELEAAEESAARDPRALKAYRDGRTCHPRLPFADWAACEPARERLGDILIAGCRDAAVARQLGFVPVHGLGAALEMAHGRAGGAPRIGFLLSPPYFPLRVRPQPSG
jgi:hypothetical protein